MGYRILSFKEHGRHHDSDAEKFYEAAEMARRGVEKMRELAEEMEDIYGERYYGGRGSYGMRSGYGERWEDHEDHDMYGARRRRDSMGRYM